VYLPVQMRRAITLMLDTSSECCTSAEHAATRAHVASELILTPTTDDVAPWTKWAHANPQKCGQAQIDLHLETFYHGKWISGRGGTSQIVFGQLSATTLQLWIIR
jgi:hypothetical protein